MQGSNNPSLNFSGSVGRVNVNRNVYEDQIGTQHDDDSNQNLVDLNTPSLDEPNLNFSGSVGGVNINSNVSGDQIGTQYKNW